MYKPENRLRKTKDIDRVFKSRVRIKDSHFALLFGPNQLSNPRFALMVSKKVGKAVIRNQIKRRIREIIRTNLEAINLKYDYLLIAYPQIVELDFEMLKQHVLRTFSRVR